MRIRRVCVFCGSSSGFDSGYLAAARGLGRALASRGCGLVYGGAHVGLMGALADTVLDAGGEVIGVIPESMVDREIAHTGLTRLHVVKTMHERKAMMADFSDAFIAMPGAYGTLDEFFEILAWAQLGIHRKPCGMLNVAAFFDSLLAFLDNAVAEGFLKQANRELFVADEDAERLVCRLGQHEARFEEKWADRRAR
ncbi:MAG: TIGR00730 family Rossman fold protein [Acidobacteria bacterium]|nr:TIGR00730 family Rossman fold protein [Acidobacteriota bacterium]